MSAEARTASHEGDEVGAALARLEADGFILRTEAGWKTSRRWQQAMARAAVSLYDEGDTSEDLRVPIACAMLDCYTQSLDDETLAALVEAMLPVEAASLGFGSGSGHG